MKKITLLFFFFITGFYCKSQIKAITELGEEVVLYKNGTWKYINENNNENKNIPINSKRIVKDISSIFLLKSNRIDVGVWLDPTVWIFKKTANQEDGEYQFSLKGEDAYGMLVTEKIEVPFENFIEISLENGQEISPDFKIDYKEYRTVNKLKVLFLQMSATLNGVKFIFMGYYYSKKNLSVRLVTYTSETLLNEYKIRMDNLLNGLVTLE